MENIKIEKIQKTEYQKVCDIYNYFVENSTATYHLQELTIPEFISYHQVEHLKTKFFSIKNINTIIGFCLLKPFNAKKQGYDLTSEITIYLKPDFCQKGIGSYVIRFLHNIAYQDKQHVIMAGICSENTASRKLFEKHGYTRCGIFKEVGFKFNRFLDTEYCQKILSHDYSEIQIC